MAPLDIVGLVRVQAVPVRSSHWKFNYQVFDFKDNYFLTRHFFKVGMGLAITRRDDHVFLNPLLGDQPVRTMTALLIGLSAAVMLSLPAVAEPFNDQSPLPVANAPGVIQVSPSMATAESDRFNDRGVDYIVATPTSSHAMTEPVMAFNMHFNRR